MESLRSKLNQTIRSQKKKARKWNKTISELFDELTPSSYDGVIASLNREQFFQLMDGISELQERYLWNCLSDTGLEILFYNVLESILSSSENFLDFVPQERLKEFLNQSEGKVVYDVFKTTNNPSKGYVIGMLEPNALFGMDAWATRSFQNFLTAEDYDELKSGVYEKISRMSAEEVARVLEETDNPEIVCGILQDRQDISTICQEIQDDRLYEVLENSDFSLLLDYESEFPVWKLDDDEKQDLYEVLKKRKSKIKRIFNFDEIVLLYCSVFPLEKEEILFEILNLTEMCDLYVRLTEEEQVQMLTIMAGQEIQGQYEDSKKQEMLQNAIYVLEHKEIPMDYLEELLLKDFKAKLSK